IVNADSSLEDFTIVNTKSSVGHESIIKKFSSLAPNCTLAGNVEVGEYSAISLSTTISNGRKIGEHSVIGAGSVLIKDAEGLSVYYGIPAKLVRFREKGDRYL
ncbi:MAG: transferase, partial [Muricauda sp.]|nr:transferase [Allomuricauda sp.]